jgi:hypothetical protein
MLPEALQVMGICTYTVYRAVVFEAFKPLSHQDLSLN